MRCLPLLVGLGNFSQSRTHDNLVTGRRQGLFVDILDFLGIIIMNLLLLTTFPLLLLNMLARRIEESFDLLPLVVSSLILDLHPENGTKEGLLQLYQF